jgi:hypothetical protein
VIKIKYISNAYSPQMAYRANICINQIELTREEFEREIIDAESHIGIRSLANIFDIDYNPSYFTVDEGDSLYVVSVHGGNLPENAKKIPNGVKLKYIRMDFGSLSDLMNYKGLKCVPIMEE